jgi:hypothetical protein
MRRSSKVEVSWARKRSRADLRLITRDGGRRVCVWRRCKAEICQDEMLNGQGHAYALYAGNLCSCGCDDHVVVAWK